MVLLRGAARTEAATLTGDVARDAREILAREGWAEQPPAARGAQRERWDSLNAIVSLADELAPRPGSSLDTLITELTERAEAQNAPTVDGVTLSTIHAAKGLEWDAVIIVGASDGLLPINLAEGPEAVEEERRLLYVAVTRAREHLVITYARARHAGGRASRKPSRFLAGIWPADEEAGARRRAGGAGARTTRKQAALEFEQDNDPATVALFEELRAWRQAVARERSRPPYTVFADVSLRSIAIIKPTTLPQLSAIHGVGPVKLQEYGDQLLRIVREHGA